MPSRLLALLLYFLASPVLAAGAAAAESPLEKVVGVRVSVDASGIIQSARPTNQTLPSALNQAAVEIARKLTFRPATINGQPAPCETTLQITVRIEPRGDGNFGLRLVEASNGMTMRSITIPRYPREEQLRGIQGLVMAKFLLNADGTVEPASVSFPVTRVSRARGRVEANAEANFRKAVQASLRTMRIDVDLVAGRPVGLEASVPFYFCSDDPCGDIGGAKRELLTQAPMDKAVTLPVLLSQPPGASEGGS